MGLGKLNYKNYKIKIIYIKYLIGLNNLFMEEKCASSDIQAF